MGKFTIFLTKSTDNHLTVIRCIKCTRLLKRTRAEVQTITNSGLYYKFIDNAINYEEQFCHSCGTPYHFLTLAEPEVQQPYITFYFFRNIIDTDDFKLDRQDNRFRLVNCARCGKTIIRLQNGKIATPVRLPQVLCHTCHAVYMVLFQ